MENQQLGAAEWWWYPRRCVDFQQLNKVTVTFVTEYGRCRYKTLPQGFLSATDGYTDRFDFITRDIDNLERCVDDAVLWDDDITGNFFRTCQYLTRCSEAGILFTEEKFQFCLKEVSILPWDSMLIMKVSNHPRTLSKSQPTSLVLGAGLVLLNKVPMLSQRQRSWRFLGHF